MFSPIPTDIDGFRSFFLRHGTATQEPPNLMTEALHVWRNRSEAMGWQVTESLSAIAEPAGKTTQSAYLTLRDEILNDLRAAGSPDVILLQLHGAMVAEYEDDCEGDIAARAREICPSAVIGVALDLHCNLTDKLLAAADLVICFKQYPHDDAPARAEELFDLAVRMKRGEISPRMAMFDCRMVSLFLTKTKTFSGFIARMTEAEGEPGILSVSLAHGFPWADLPENGARMLVIANESEELAARRAEELGREFFALRDRLVPNYPDLRSALDRATAASAGPVVLADMSDNSGAGAPGDATYVLHEILNRGLTSVASGLYWDPAAVNLCKDAGDGADITLQLGGKAEPASGRPIAVSGRIMKIASGLTQHLGDALEPLGTLIWLRLEGEVDLIINDMRTQVYHPEVFEQVGINLAGKSLIVVKSFFHFYTAFEDIASEIIFCATPGRVNPNTAEIPFEWRDLNFWPRVADPFSSSSAGSGRKVS